MWNLPDILVQQSRGSPFQYVFPTSGTPVIQDAIAVIRGTSHRDEARRFVEFVGSLAFQIQATREAFRLPARQDVPADSLPEWARDAREQLRVEEMDWGMLAERGAGWMQYWDRNVRGRGLRTGPPVSR